MRLGNSQLVFFALIKAGLWRQTLRLLSYGDIDYSEVYKLAEEQGVIGLVASGFENVSDIKIPKKEVLLFIGQTLRLEQRNQMMNLYIKSLVGQLRSKNIFPVLIKGQGVAQCYEMPLWRACGDIDLLLSPDNYEQAKYVLASQADSVAIEFKDFKHIGMTFGGWVVELHGTLHCRLSKKIDKVLDQIQERVLCQHEVRVWHNDDTDVFVPAPDNDVIFLFTHVLKHFYQGGIGLRQICDLSRFLWVYNNVLDKDLLKQRLYSMGIMDEWKSFAAYMVDLLGTPSAAIPLYSSEKKWSNKAKVINGFVLEMGNFGRNRDNSYLHKSPFLLRKFISFWRRTIDSIRHFYIFPLNSLRAWWTILITGIKLI